MAQRSGKAPFARTDRGDLAGAWDGELAVFRGVPFAAPPVGDLRFAAPMRHGGWTGALDATRPGRSAPQPPSRLEAVMGRVDFDQDEDCLTLNIWAPPAGEGPYPVLLWVHGGGFSTGSGSWPLYSGGELARNGRIVVVTANYRLGVLGYLYLPEFAHDHKIAANRGLTDQIAALGWIHDNIAEFGGDPEAVTIAGQSAGGAAIAAMMADPTARRLFKRAILQSPVVEAAISIEDAAVIRDHFIGVLGISRSRISELQHLPVDRLLAAQTETAKALTRFGAPVGAIQQVVDGVTIRGDLIDGAREAAGEGTALMAGTTRDEMDAFMMQEHLRYASRPDAIQMLRGAALERFTERVFDRYLAATARQLLASRSAEKYAKTASAVLTDAHFRVPTLRFIKSWVAGGGLAHLYRFDWAPRSGSPFAACHCIDIPLALGNLREWQEARLPPAMLNGCDPAEFGVLSQAVQNAWIAFARSGRPDHDRLPSWPQCTISNLSSMRFDVESQVVANQDEYIQDLWAD